MRQDFPIGDFIKKMILDDFDKRKISFDESSMVYILEDPTSSFRYKRNAGIALRELGTKASINALKRCIQLGDQDLQAICILTIAQIARKDASDFLVSLLKVKRIQKAYVLWALFAIDAQESISEIQKFVHTSMKFDRRSSTKSISKVEHGLVMIDNYGLESEIRIEILDFYKENWEEFNSQQQRILMENTEYFKND